MSAETPQRVELVLLSEGDAEPVIDLSPPYLLITLTEPDTDTD